MKNILSILLVSVIMFLLIGCGQSSVSKEAESSTVSENAETANAQSENTETDTESMALVAYFSATGNTKAVAETIASAANADIFEIIPAQPYTDADLDYNDDGSRSTTEMNDSSARPEIASSIDNMNDYDTIYLGYPIWWNEAPRIINTFMESYDFSGKTIIPFCTSGGSGISGSVSKLKEQYPSVNWLDGERFNKNASESDILNLINSIN